MKLQSKEASNYGKKFFPLIANNVKFHTFKVDLKPNKLDIDSIKLPDVEKKCLKSLRPVEEQKKKLLGFELTYEEGNFIKLGDNLDLELSDEKEDSMGYINYYEYTNLINNNIR